MAKTIGRPEPHPDDFMSVTIALDFRAKLNPNVRDPPPIDTTGCQCTLPAVAAADYLEQVVKAIRERRLYGFMVQDAAESAVGCGEWMKMTNDHLLDEATTREIAEKNTQESTSAPRED
jgi:hypothetical protein